MTITMKIWGFTVARIVVGILGNVKCKCKCKSPSNLKRIWIFHRWKKAWHKIWPTLFKLKWIHWKWNRPSRMLFKSYFLIGANGHKKKIEENDIKMDMVVFRLLPTKQPPLENSIQGKKVKAGPSKVWRSHFRKNNWN